MDQTFPDHPHTDVELVGNRPVQAVQSHREESNPQVCCTSQTLEKNIPKLMFLNIVARKKKTHQGRIRLIHVESLTNLTRASSLI